MKVGVGDKEKDKTCGSSKACSKLELSFTRQALSYFRERKRLLKRVGTKKLHKERAFAILFFFHLAPCPDKVCLLYQI